MASNYLFKILSHFLTTQNLHKNSIFNQKCLMLFYGTFYLKNLNLILQKTNINSIKTIIFYPNLSNSKKNYL